MSADLQTKIGDLLSVELGLYKTLRTMVSRELEAIVLDHDMDGLLKILERKQEVVSRLQLLADSWQDVLASVGIRRGRDEEGFWDQLSALVSTERQAGIAKQLQDAREAAADLMKAEEEAQAELEKHARSLRDQVVSRARGRQVAASYTKLGGSSR